MKKINNRNFFYSFGIDKAIKSPKGDAAVVGGKASQRLAHLVVREGEAITIPPIDKYATKVSIEMMEPNRESAHFPVLESYAVATQHGKVVLGNFTPAIIVLEVNVESFDKQRAYFLNKITGELIFRYRDGEFRRVSDMEIIPSDTILDKDGNVSIKYACYNYLCKEVNAVMTAGMARKMRVMLYAENLKGLDLTSLDRRARHGAGSKLLALQKKGMKNVVKGSTYTALSKAPASELSQMGCIAIYFGKWEIEGFQASDGFALANAKAFSKDVRSAIGVDVHPRVFVGMPIQFRPAGWKCLGLFVQEALINAFVNQNDPVLIDMRTVSADVLRDLDLAHSGQGPYAGKYVKISWTGSFNVEAVTDLNGYKSPVHLEDAPYWNILKLGAEVKIGKGQGNVQLLRGPLTHAFDRTMELLCDRFEAHIAEHYESLIGDGEAVDMAALANTTVGGTMIKMAPRFVRDNYAPVFRQEANSVLEGICNRVNKYNIPMEGFFGMIIPDLSAFFLGKPSLGAREVYNTLLVKKGFTETVIHRNPSMDDCENAFMSVAVPSIEEEGIVADMVKELVGNLHPQVVMLPAEENLLCLLGGADFDGDTVFCLMDTDFIELFKSISNTVAVDIQIDATGKDKEISMSPTMALDTLKGLLELGNEDVGRTTVLYSPFAEIMTLCNRAIDARKKSETASSYEEVEKLELIAARCLKLARHIACIILGRKDGGLEGSGEVYLPELVKGDIDKYIVDDKTEALVFSSAFKASLTIENLVRFAKGGEMIGRSKQELVIDAAKKYFKVDMRNQEKLQSLKLRSRNEKSIKLDFKNGSVVREGEKLTSGWEKVSPKTTKFLVSDSRNEGQTILLNVLEDSEYVKYLLSKEQKLPMTTVVGSDFEVSLVTYIKDIFKVLSEAQASDKALMKEQEKDSDNGELMYLREKYNPMFESLRELLRVHTRHMTWAERGELVLGICTKDKKDDEAVSSMPHRLFGLELLACAAAKIHGADALVVREEIARTTLDVGTNVSVVDGEGEGIILYNNVTMNGVIVEENGRQYLATTMQCALDALYPIGEEVSTMILISKRDAKHEAAAKATLEKLKGGEEATVIPFRNCTVDGKYQKVSDTLWIENKVAYQVKMSVKNGDSSLNKLFFKDNKFLSGNIRNANSYEFTTKAGEKIGALVTLLTNVNYSSLKK